MPSIPCCAAAAGAALGADGSALSALPDRLAWIHGHDAEQPVPDLV